MCVGPRLGEQLELIGTRDRDRATATIRSSNDFESRQDNGQPLKRKAGSASPAPGAQSKRSRADEETEVARTSSKRSSGDWPPDNVLDAPPPRKVDEQPTAESSKQQQQISQLDRRKSGVTQEDRRRGQRLFGGLLSTLSQSTANPQQKRRQEIEKRQQERAQTQRIEEEKHRAEKLAQLQHARGIGQVELDEKVVRCSPVIPVLPGRC